MQMTHVASHMAQGLNLLTISLREVLLAAAVFGMPLTAHADLTQAAIQSPDGRNSIMLHAADDDGDRAQYRARYTVSRDGRKVIVGGDITDGRRAQESDPGIRQVKREIVPQLIARPAPLTMLTFHE